MEREKYEIASRHLTRLTDQDLANVQRTVLDYLNTHEFVTNRILRDIVGITYDQAIFFYVQMLNRKVLQKIGARSTTRYVLSRAH
jgi:hypothetical protein